MSTCSVSGLPVTEKLHWIANHAKSGYITKFSLIRPDIIHGEIVADHDVSMDHIELAVFQNVIKECGLWGEAIHMLFGLTHVKGISFIYKKNLIDMLYNSGPVFKLLAIYNVDREVRSVMETFAAIAPEESRIVIVDSYREAMQLILDSRSGKLGTERYRSIEEQQYGACKKEFLSALARLSWLNMLDHPIALPENSSPFYPYFKALEAFQHDLREKESLRQQEFQNIIDQYEKEITEKTIRLNAREAMSKKKETLLEQEKKSLNDRIVSKNMALKRLSSLIAEKRSKIKMIYDLVEQLDIEPALKKKITNCYGEIVDYFDENSRITGREISVEDSRFIAELQRKHPDLNRRYLDLCMLIKQNLSTQEIARLVGITTRGIESMRYRLHKKLGLPKHESIRNYLRGIADD